MSDLKAQDLPKEDLSDLSGPGTRGSGLSNLFPSPSTKKPEAAPAKAKPVDDTPPRAAAPEAAVPPAAPATSATPTRTTARRGPGRPRTRQRPSGTLYVTAGLKARFENFKHKGRKTNLEVVLEAISSCHGRLAEIINDARIQTGVANDLFPGDPSAVRYLGGGSVQIQFSPTTAQEEVLDRLGKELGIETRSTWIAPVLNEFLPGRREKRPS